MLKLFFVFTFACVVFSTPDDGCTVQQRKDFEKYKKNYDKTYISPSAEDQARKCFCKTDNETKEHNANNKDYKQAHNDASDECNKVKTSKTGEIFDPEKVGASYNLPAQPKKVGNAAGGDLINGGIDFRNYTFRVKNTGDVHR